MSDPIDEIFAHRGKSTSFSGVSHNFITLFGGKPTELIFYEPDPNTYRDNFYYNTRENRLFKKMKAGDLFVWKDVGE